MNDQLLKILCEINNRLNEITITLQTLGFLYASQPDGTRVEWLVSLSKRLNEQQNKFATFEPASYSGLTRPPEQ